MIVRFQPFRPLILLALLFALPAIGDSDAVLATVNGRPITESEVRQQAAAEFTQLENDYRRNRHELLLAQLDAMIEERLIELEAAARQKTKEEILASIPPAAVSDAEVDAFYEQNKAQIPRPKNDVAGQIRQYLLQQKQQNQRETFIATLQERYKVDVRLEPLRVAVDATGASRGPADAKVTIVEFSDFECSFCARFLPTLQQINAKYGDRVRVVFRHFPLDFHKQARKAAEASLCAAEQGKFWQMHDAMFADQTQLAPSALKATAARIGLDAQTFDTCLDSGRFAAKVEEDVRAGRAVGVNGTPATFVNGRLVSGAVPFEEMSEIIEDELRRAGAKTKSGAAR